jgi:hypothetical protein
VIPLSTVFGGYLTFKKSTVGVSSTPTAQLLVAPRTAITARTVAMSRDHTPVTVVHDRDLVTVIGHVRGSAGNEVGNVSHSEPVQANAIDQFAVENPDMIDFVIHHIPIGDRLQVAATLDARDLAVGNV